MRNVTLHTSCLLLAVFALQLLSGCIRDQHVPDCPPFKVRVLVKDKNYFNVEQVELEDSVSEDLPFAAYVPTLHYTVRNAATGEVVNHREVFNVDPGLTEVDLIFEPSLPYGKYVATFWGGGEHCDEFIDKGESATLHPDGMEGDDYYFTTDTIDYHYRHEVELLEMERVKGKLIIEAVDLPADVTAMSYSVTNLFAVTDHHFQYSGNTEFSKTVPYSNTNPWVEKVMLAPTVSKKNSLITTAFECADGSRLVPKAISITLKRNTITVVRYVWSEEKQEFEIYVLLNNSWDQVNNMEMEID